tara:strand:- start:658 stop:1206 length:549 start_codon:yes stop_codon:yes gene_type:complete
MTKSEKIAQLAYEAGVRSAYSDYGLQLRPVEPTVKSAQPNEDMIRQLYLAEAARAMGDEGQLSFGGLGPGDQDLISARAQQLQQQRPDMISGEGPFYDVNREPMVERVEPEAEAGPAEQAELQQQGASPAAEAAPVESIPQDTSIQEMIQGYYNQLIAAGYAPQQAEQIVMQQLQQQQMPAQ